MQHSGTDYFTELKRVVLSLSVCIGQRVNTCSESSALVSPSSAQHALSSLRALKISWPPFDDSKLYGRWYGNTQKRHKSKIIKSNDCGYS